MRAIGAMKREIGIYSKETPKIIENHILIKTSFSAISPGTELSMADASGDIQIDLGYSASGIVVEVGKNVEGYQKGDRVAVYGAPYVGHREYLLVPKTLVTKVPENVLLEDASMCGLGAIAIHALRQANLQFGESCIVVGLGIYGQLISQIAINSGLQVFALNRSLERATLLSEVAAIKTYTDEIELEKDIMLKTNGSGVDAVFLCTGGDSSYLTNKSLEWIRDRGKSIIVGNLEPNYSRSLMFKKEAEILISRAGGPGRYDKLYEKGANDHPLGYVRWTEGRNIEEFIRLLSERRIYVSPYYSTPTSIDYYEEAYRFLAAKGAKFLSHIFSYEGEKNEHFD